MQLRGKRVLITGASRGIGESLARRFAGVGATVALVARTEDVLRPLAAELGGSAHPADLMLLLASSGFEPVSVGVYEGIVAL